MLQLMQILMFLSWAAVETKLIVEKGLWDDLFPLEGGGQVHMKLQFVLSEDERNRIRLMVLCYRILFVMIIDILHLNPLLYNLSLYSFMFSYIHLIK